MTRASHRPSQREALLEAGLDVIRQGGSLSLESAARAAGITKPGLMYHFPSKESLVGALVDHLLHAYEIELEALLVVPLAESTAEDRLGAYVRWSVTHGGDAADLVMLSDPRLRITMSARWAERLGSWVEVPADLPADRRARLHAARLLADGCWFADASGILPLAASDRDAVLATGLDLLTGGER
jgi:AcrR family transcriptional regulator